VSLSRFIIRVLDFESNLTSSKVVCKLLLFDISLSCKCVNCSCTFSIITDVSSLRERSLASALIRFWFSFF